MTLQSERQLDEIGWQLLKLLQQNARQSLRQIGDIIGMTAPAVAERVRRLEDAGVVAGYRAEIDLEKVGLPILAFIYLTCNSTQSHRFRKAVHEMPQIIECHCVTGSETYILKVAVASVPHLEHLLLDLTNHGEVRTSLVLSTQVKTRMITESTLLAGEL
jgi:Lrp/AsnC family transcriptional regulator, leucine-responsive regulatory protein